MLASRALQNGSKKLDRRRPSYQPTRGFIGKYEVDVANYLFKNPNGLGHVHCQALVDSILGKSIQTHHHSSVRLTRFLKKRDLTFQKSDKNGVYRIFTVPVTTSVVPLPKSIFNSVESAAQILMVSLRKVLQGIYGAGSIEESPFVQSLPDDIRATFIDATKNSPHYIPQLHHPVMQDYPFLDNVGLDLVLVEEYFQNRGKMTDLIRAGREQELPELPFRVLELNAGSPSGASNNVNILEGILREDPSVLDSLGRVMPNDHFKVLRETYRSLGESWTGRTDGVQVLLPPGGANGASPEIHQLAAFSGLIYCDPGQLYQDQDRWIRLRTVTGEDPIVTAIYSRVNSDSALFDRDAGILLRDPEDGSPVYCVDLLKPWKKNDPEYIQDENGNPIPLESEYAIPNALQAIHERKLYLGGLNRLLDNKIILATLTDYAPEFYQQELLNLGLKLESPRIQPPECLPSKPESLDIIEKNPADWVIKAPNLSGGTGVHILMTLDDRKRREVIALARENPEQYAYQKVVKIARIPVAMRQKGAAKFRFANLAADIRMWVFFGGKDTLPKLTHNALVRYAPKEKGPMSSIVNTSKGGGYAPFVVVDDLDLPSSVSAKESAAPMEPEPFPCAMPAFVGAQMVQVANIIHELRTLVQNADAEMYRISGYLYTLKVQVREIASFIHPRCMETIYSMIEIVEKRINAKSIAAYFLKMNGYQARLVSLLETLTPILNAELFMVLDEFHVVNQDLVNRGYSAELKRQDLFNFGHFSFIIRNLINENPEQKRNLNRLRSLLKEMITNKFPGQKQNTLVHQRLISLLDQFCDLAYRRLKASKHATEFANLFNGSVAQQQILYRETFVTSHAGQAPRSATEWEVVNEQKLAESNFVDAEIAEARAEWLRVTKPLKSLPKEQRDRAIENARVDHFVKYPRLKELQAIIDKRENTSVSDLISLMEVMPYAAYNLRQYAIEQGVSFVELFKDKLTAERIAILNRKDRIEACLSLDEYSGECYAKKKAKHGLISEGERYLWVAAEQSPLIQLYTIGHELIHAAQIKEVMEMEVAARKSAPLEFARFLNYFGNFLSLAAHTLEYQAYDVSQFRQPLYGLADRIVSQFFTPVIQDVREGLAKKPSVYHQKLKKYGSLFGYMMPVSNVVKVKALREVVPALENAKNIIFAKECGLRVELDEVKSALPIANRAQVTRYRGLITEAARGWKLDFEALRVIASHQYYGVMFPRAMEAKENLTIDSDPGAIYLNTGYNQTQQ